MITENQVKSELSIAYVNAVAAICNFGVEITRIDMDSVDVTIRSNGMLADDSTIRSPEIQLQLKATENFPLINGSYSFPLSIKNYDDLRARTLTPRLLVVLNLPTLRKEWLSHSSNELVLRSCAFWINLKGMSESSNTTTVTVHLPSTNIFSPEVLKQSMIDVSRELLV